MPKLDVALFSSIVGDIYDCVVEPDGWSAALTRIRDAVDAAYTTVALANPSDDRGRFAAQSPWDAEQMRILQTDYGFEDIPGLLSAVMGDIDTPVATLSRMDEASLQATPFFQNWAKPQGLREACITKFVHTPDRIGLLGVTTRLDRDVISAEEQRFLAQLSPHLRRAALIGDLLDQARVASHVYHQTLEAMATPIVLTAKDGRILYANASAEHMFAESGPIRAHGGLLRTNNPAIDGALLAAISASAAADAALGARGIGLPISGPGEPPAVAYVLPLSEGTARAGFRPARAAVFVSTSIATTPVPEAIVTTLFDLTPAEARVLLRIGAGWGTAATAESLGISDNTLKTHLGRIYSKTGTARQPDLVRLLADIGVPVAGTFDSGPSQSGQ